jgi:hypothetical protein
MNTKLSTNRKLIRMSANILSIVVILALAFPTMGSAYAQDEAPFLRAFPDQGRVDGWYWTADQQVFLEINGQMFDPQTADGDGYVDFALEGYDLERGAFLTMSGGDISVSYTARQLFVEDINMDTQTISGTVDGQQTVHLWVPDVADEYVETDESGNWTVDLTSYENAVLLPGVCGNAEAWGEEESASSTIIDWCIPEHPPNPHFTIFPEWEFFDGLDWPDGAIVSISVASKPECSLERESWGGFFNGNFPEGCNIEAGDTVTFDDGTTNRWHEVRNLYVTDVDMGENTVTGKADEGETVYVWPHDGGFEPLQANFDGSGAWQVDFDDLGYDIQDGSEGRSEIRDGMGNATASDWHVTHPHFTVFPEWEWFDGLDWPNEAMVTITVADIDGNNKPECATAKESWGYFFNGSFGEGCDVVVGDEVTFTYGDIVRTHTVQNLSVTKVNQEDDTVKGIADPGVEVYVWPHATGEQLVVTAKTKGAAKGKWNVDFSGIFDLTPGECGRSEIRDEVGNSTAVDWCIPNPTFVAYMPVTIVGYDWPIGDTIDISINDGEYTAQAKVGNADWDPTVVLFELWQDDFTMEAGDHIIMTDEDTGITKEVWVTNLAITDFDLGMEKVFGTYDPAYSLWVWLYDLEGQVPETDPDNGSWIATFTELPPGAWGGATQWDEDGDGTSIDFRVPNTRVDIATQPDWVDSGVTVSAGQSFTIQAFGLMNPCSDTYPNGADFCIFYTPEGAEGVVPYENEFGIFPGPGLPFMALLGRIGEGEPFYVGAGGTFTAEESGKLWFTPNDNLRTDNQGAYSVLVWLEP